jgi:hypothetical protein
MDNRKRLAERYVYLCDGMIIICKMSKKGGVGLVNTFYDISNKLARFYSKNIEKSFILHK